MKLDRNVNPDGRGKYALLNLRTLALETGKPFSADEFFVLKLKDRNAKPALLAYADSIEPRDAEFAAEVRELAKRSGESNPFWKDPD